MDTKKERGRHKERNQKGRKGWNDRQVGRQEIKRKIFVSYYPTTNK